ncbi:DUF2163 domain-containing protein [Falsiroseomonas sp.]|uniref:DUF2163 domain-containing protein n=1 Tax=Falsiroseomonas sp. TaxID=2870721 RepID=UPI003565A5F1
MTTTRITQGVVESLVDAAEGAALVTQLLLEALDAGADPILTTQFVLEALTEDGAPVYLTQAVLEVLISDSLQADEVSQVCLLWRLRRRDGTEQRFASLDADVIWGGQTWTAAAPFDATAAEASRSLAAGQMEVAGLLAAPEITAEDLLNGIYDDAEVTMLRVDWADPSRGAEVVLAGRIGRVTAGQTRFEAELLLPSALLDRPVLDLYTPECRVDLFSPACGIAAAAWTRTAAITAVLSDTAFVAAGFTEPAGWADYGRVTITSGANASARREVRSHSADGLVELWEPFAAPLAIGDAISITAGCDKRLATCRDRFANVANFRGFPHVPGTDAAFRYPDAR